MRVRPGNFGTCTSMVLAAMVLVACGSAKVDPVQSSTTEDGRSDGGADGQVPNPADQWGKDGPGGQDVADLRYEDLFEGEVDTTPLTGEYRLIGWNDLGMHCLNPTYDKAVILPPYNTVWVQVVKRGDPPQVVTDHITVTYRVLDNTFSYGKTDEYGGKYQQFWDNSQALFGVKLPKDKGLNLVEPERHNGLTGKLVKVGNRFQVDGIPVVPVKDDGTWAPYQLIELTAKDGAGKVLAKGIATLPTSNEIRCSKCHGQQAFDDILGKHKGQGPGKLGGNLQALTPVVCASCHGSPALGMAQPGASGMFLSAAIHGFHSDKGAACYDCHPGEVTKCSRSKAHTRADGNCVECHGSMADVAGGVKSGTRIPWAQEPKCVTCHNTGVKEVDTAETLYRNASGHGQLHCAACHGSPHAQWPSLRAEDNKMPEGLQGRSKALGSCGVCHGTSKMQTGGDFAEKHGGANPDERNACHTCHTRIPTDTTKWPHAYQWKAHAGYNTVEDD